MERATAICHGAASIINAIATCKGAAFGVGLWTKAEVQITDDPGNIETKIVSDLAENPLLIKKTVERVFDYFHFDEFGAKVKTWSNIPIARGLKSSSVAANAITLAVVAASKQRLDDLKVVNLAVDGALDAKVTITGAFDDACASYFGGVMITDNTKRRIIKRFAPSQDLSVLFHVPSTKAYTNNSNVDRMKIVAPLVKIAYKEALTGNYWSALTLNGLIYSAALGYDSSITIDALMAGALAAGLSGKGPAVTAIVPAEKIDFVKAALQAYEGEIIQTQMNCEKAKLVV
jgi:shikimate kinase